MAIDSRELASLARMRLPPATIGLLSKRSIEAAKLRASMNGEHFDFLLALVALRAQLGRLAPTGRKLRTHVELHSLADAAAAANPEFFESKAVQQLAEMTVTKRISSPRKKPAKQRAAKSARHVLSTIRYKSGVRIGHPNAHCELRLEFESPHAPVTLRLSAEDILFLCLVASYAIEQELDALRVKHKPSKTEAQALRTLAVGIVNLRKNAAPMVRKARLLASSAARGR